MRRAPDVIHYSAEAWRSSKSRDFHRRARRGVRALPSTPLATSCRKGGDLPRLPRSQDFLSIPRRDRKAHLARELPRERRRIPDSCSISSDTPRSAATPRFR